jgi:uncharacterized protein YjdB
MVRPVRGICGFILVVLMAGCTPPVTNDITSVAITPATATVAVGQAQVLKLEATRRDGTKEAVSGAWASSASAVATVNASGVVTGVAAGSATITATYESRSATATVTVPAPPPPRTLASIAATPEAVNLTVGGTQQLAVTGTYSDDTTAVLTASASYVSSAPGVASVSAAGVVTAVAAGQATITATASGRSDTVAVTVQAAPPVEPTLLSLAVTPSPVALTVGGTAQLLVTGTYSAGPTRDLTASATFTTSAASTATVSAAGLVTAVASGSATVTASVTPAGASAAVTGTTTVQVTEVAPPPAGVVFSGAYGEGVEFRPFGGSTNDLSVDATTRLDGTDRASLKVVFPEGGYTGGAFIDARGPQDLSAFDAVTFWAKASAPLAFEKVGLGNNAVGPNLYDVETFGLAVTTTWQKFIVPVPLAARLTAVDGLFHFADGTNRGPATLWLADIRYEQLGTGVLGVPTPAWTKGAASIASGATYQVEKSDLKVDYTVNAQPLTLSVPGQGYFTFSSDSAVAVVGENGLITGTNGGTTPQVANITASLGAFATANRLALTVAAGSTGGGGGQAPTTAPPAPAVAAANVMSVLGPAYTGGEAGGDYRARVGSYHATCFGPPDTSVADHTIAGTSHVVKRYTMGSHRFANIELIGVKPDGPPATPPDSAICSGGEQSGANLLDASAMTHVHFDVWSPTGSTNFQLHLVNADGTRTIAGPGAATGATPGSNYASGANTVAAGTWVSFDVPLTTLGPPGAAGGLNRLGLIKFFTTDAGTFFITNVYLYR